MYLEVRCNFLAAIRRAKAACSRGLYLVSASTRDLLMKNTGLCFSSSFSLNRAALTAMSETAKYIKSVSPVSRLARIGGSTKYCLIWMKAWSHSLFHPARLTPLRVAKNGFRRSVNWEINPPKAGSRPMSCCIPFLELGTGDS